MTAHNHIMIPSIHIFVHYHKFNQWTLNGDTKSIFHTLENVCVGNWKYSSIDTECMRMRLVCVTVWNPMYQMSISMLLFKCAAILLFFCFGTLRLCELLGRTLRCAVIYPTLTFHLFDVVLRWSHCCYQEILSQKSFTCQRIERTFFLIFSTVAHFNCVHFYQIYWLKRLSWTKRTTIRR